MAIMEVRGGSAGPLYGTLIGGLGVDLNDGENTLEAEGVKRMFTGWRILPQQKWGIKP